MSPRRAQCHSRGRARRTSWSTGAARLRAPLTGRCPETHDPRPGDWPARPRSRGRCPPCIRAVVLERAPRRASQGRAGCPRPARREGGGPGPCSSVQLRAPVWLCPCTLEPAVERPPSSAFISSSEAGPVVVRSGRWGWGWGPTDVVPVGAD